MIFKPVDYFRELRWEEVFDQAGPVEIELGCGKGRYLTWLAGQRPQHNFLGVDRQLVRLRKTDKKVTRLRLINVRLLRLEAGYLVTRLIPADSVSAYHILFPDPWPKRRHATKRLIQPAFVAHLHRTLVGAGEIHLATDDEPYFRQMEAVMNDDGQFTPLEPVPVPVEARTEFETLFVAKGQTIYRARYQRRD